MTEIWLDVFSHVGSYQVSNLGRVRSLSRLVASTRPGTFRLVSGQIIKSRPGNTGYLTVNLWKKQKSKTNLVHRLVLEAFIGPCPEDMEACHKNGNRQDNRLANLRWDSRTNNQHDRIAHGTYLCGEKHPKAKITDEQVEKIRSLHRSGGKRVEIAKSFGITLTQVCNICSGKSRNLSCVTSR